jgi:hypothetical protein
MRWVPVHCRVTAVAADASLKNRALLLLFLLFPQKAALADLCLLFSVEACAG